MSIGIKVRDAVILAGGKGNRLQNGINGCSKPMTPILGKRLITFAIDSLLECGVDNIYVVYHSSTADVLTLSTYNDTYSNALKFIEDSEQKGILSAFYYAKDFVGVPLIMTFADIIVQKKDFRQMVLNALNKMDKHPDLLIQTVSTPSIASEKKLIVEDGAIINLGKSGTIEPVAEYCDVKSGGMAYLWFKDPFLLIETFLAEGNYQSSQFLKTVMQKHTVLEMAINDMWDIDTREDVLRTEKILRSSPKEIHPKFI